MTSIIKRPSAWLPVMLSLTVLVMWLAGIAMFGPPVREPDEGTAAHLFQIWLVLEVLMVGYFVIRWLPQSPKPALAVMAIQFAAALAASAPVFYFNL